MFEALKVNYLKMSEFKSRQAFKISQKVIYEWNNYIQIKKENNYKAEKF